MMMIKRSLILLLFFTLLRTTALSQVHNLVFEGAGVRGLAYAGVIKELEERGMMNQIEKVGGTSAGALTALMISLGYNAAEMEELISEMRLQRFNDGRFFFIGGYFRMKGNFGWYRGKTLTRWVEDLIERKTGSRNLTFSEMANLGLPDLYITGTNLSDQTTEIFSRLTYPSMRVADAVRISVSIPMYFEAVCLSSSGTVVSCKEGSGKVFVDGGISSNFPISIFDSVDSLGERRPDMSTLGFRIDTPGQIREDAESRRLASWEIVSFRDYIGAFYTYTLENLNRNDLLECDWKRTVSISSGSIGPKLRKLSRSEKNELITNGKIATASFIEDLVK